MTVNNSIHFLADHRENQITMFLLLNYLCKSSLFPCTNTVLSVMTLLMRFNFRKELYKHDIRYCRDSAVRMDAKTQ